MKETIQYSFKRHEIKFLLTPEQYGVVYPALRDHMTEDTYGKYSIRNIYFDTPDYMLIRHSLDKPVYKEKFRLRSYGLIAREDAMFAEIKKKYKGIVYKRRIILPGCDFDKLLQGEEIAGCDTQIRQEILQFFRLYPGLTPKAYISYDRTALTGIGNEKSLRVTFDRNISFREENLVLWADSSVKPVLPENKEIIVMEIKVDNAVPFWLASLLSEWNIYRGSFSKYGTYYMNFVANNLQERIQTYAK